MKKFLVEVTQAVQVEIDETHLSEEFMKVFRDVMYDFDELSEHAEHIGQCEARGIIGLDRFLEGYGDLREMNIKTVMLDQDCEVKPLT